MPLAINGLKVCSSPACVYQGQPQPLENFSNHHRYPDGKQPQCKACLNALNAKYRKTEARQKSQNKYNHSEKAKEARTNYAQTSEVYKATQERKSQAGKESRAIARRLREEQKPPYIPPTEKSCTNSGCIHQGQLQPMDNFANSSRKKDGKDSWCKDCKRKWERNQDKAHARMLDEKYRNSPKGIAARVRYQESEQVKERDRQRSILDRKDPSKAPKILARNRLNKAVRSGKIPHVSTQKCSQCSASAQHYHHYLGYEPEHWYDVEPYCAKCHRKLPV